MTNLSQKKCIDCEQGVKLPEKTIEEYKDQLSDQWQIRDGKLFRHVDCENFKASKALVDKIAELAETEGHHPDITFSFKYVDVVLYTHSANGLTESDFVLAAKIDAVV